MWYNIDNVEVLMVIQMKKLLVFILIISMLSSVTAFADDEEFTSVSDGASMLSEATERYIYTQNKILSDKAGARVIIATATDSGELSITEYADKLYDEMGIGHIGRKNSVFILLCRDENDYCIKVSDGISAALTDSYAQSCLAECMEKDFAKENYDKAVIKTYNRLASWYAKQYDIKLSLTEDMSDYKNMIKTEKERKLLKNVIIISLVVIVVVGGLYALIHFRRKKRMKDLLRKRQERRRRYTLSLRGK